MQYYLESLSLLKSASCWRSRNYSFLLCNQMPVNTVNRRISEDMKNDVSSQPLINYHRNASAMHLMVTGLTTISLSQKYLSPRIMVHSDVFNHWQFFTCNTVWLISQMACLMVCPGTRGVTRLDGARGKKQVWHPHVQTWGFSEENLLYWRKYLWHCWDFSAPS